MCCEVKKLEIDFVGFDVKNCQRRMRKIDLYFKSEKQRNGSLISKFQYHVVGRHFWKPIINYLLLERQELITERTYFWEPLLQFCSSVVTFQRFSQTPLASFGMSGCHQPAPGRLVAWHHRTPTPQAYFYSSPFAALQPDINIAIPALNSSFWFRVITYPSFPMYPQDPLHTNSHHILRLEHCH